MTENKYIKVAVIGRPNIGKTSIVNCLTGSNLKVGNFTGATVGITEVMVKVDDKIVGVIDTPGIYSIKNPISKDEQSVSDLLKQDTAFDVILNVIDVRKFDIELSLTEEILETTDKPVILCFNYFDKATHNLITIDCDAIYKASNIHCITTDSCTLLSCCNHDVMSKITQTHQQRLNVDIKTLAQQAINIKPKPKKINFTKILDSIFLSKILAIPAFLAIMLGVFQLTFKASEPIKELINTAFFYLKKIAPSIIQNKTAISIINDGILQGVLSLLQFVPSIAILFLFVNILEKSGYMARISFIMDSFMRIFGLSGRVAVPFMTGFGCSIPAYLSARILPDKIQRLAAMFAIGFMTCSAKFTFFMMIVSSVFDSTIAPYVMLAIYIISAVIGLAVAMFVGLFMRSKDQFSKRSLPYFIEMPEYRMPNPIQCLHAVKLEVKSFLQKVGTFIVICSCALWFMGNYPVKQSLLEQYSVAQLNNDSAKINELEKERLSLSLLGTAGQLMSPIFSPLGFDWKMNISVLSGLLGKEVGVSTLGILYNFDFNGTSDEQKSSLKSQISMPSCIAFIAFFMLYLPCMSATVTFKKEAEYKYATTALVISTSIIAWVFSFVAYKAALLIF